MLKFEANRQLVAWHDQLQKSIPIHPGDPGIGSQCLAQEMIEQQQMSYSGQDLPAREVPREVPRVPRDHHLEGMVARCGRSAHDLEVAHRRRRGLGSLVVARTHLAETSEGGVTSVLLCQSVHLGSALSFSDLPLSVAQKRRPLYTELISMVKRLLAPCRSRTRCDISETPWQVDFILGDQTAVEVKAKEAVSPQDLRSLHALAEEKKLKRYLCVCLERRRRRVGAVEVLPYGHFLEALWDGDLTA